MKERKELKEALQTQEKEKRRTSLAYRVRIRRALSRLTILIDTILTVLRPRLVFSEGRYLAS